MLDLTLERHAAEGRSVLEILGVYRDGKRRIGVFAAARMIAHAVGHDRILLALRRDDHAARAHAERIARASVRAPRQVVFCRRQQRMTGEFSVKRPVKLALKVLDAHADRKRLRLEVNAVFMQREEGIARRMTDRDDRPLAGDVHAVRADGGQRAVFQ